MSYGKKIELFLPSGSADDIIVAELSNWNGLAVKVPRTEVKSCKQDITGPGVYFLFWKDDDEVDHVYIGEAENVKERLIQHLSNDKTEWTTAVIFHGRDLNKAHIRYLENRLVIIAKDCNRYVIETKNTYAKTVLKEADIAVMEEFIDNIKVLINALGYKVIEPLTHVKPSDLMQSESDEYWNWLNSLGAVSGALKNAVDYSRNRRKELEVFLKHGEIEISNNQAENAIRPVVVGRKNCYFRIRQKALRPVLHSTQLLKQRRQIS